MSHLSVLRIFWKLFSYFSNKIEVYSGEQEKNHFLCEAGIEKSVPLDHSLALLKPIDAEW